MRTRFQRQPAARGLLLLAAAACLALLVVMGLLLPAGGRWARQAENTTFLVGNYSKLFAKSTLLIPNIFMG